jgi:hypothetical protein
MEGSGGSFSSSEKVSPEPAFGAVGLVGALDASRASAKMPDACHRHLDLPAASGVEARPESRGF